MSGFVPVAGETGATRKLFRANLQFNKKVHIYVNVFTYVYIIYYKLL